MPPEGTCTQNPAEADPPFHVNAGDVTVPAADRAPRLPYRFPGEYETPPPVHPARPVANPGSVFSAAGATAVPSESVAETGRL